MILKSIKFFLIAGLIFSGKIFSQEIDSISTGTYNDTTDNYIPTDYQSVTNGKKLFTEHCSYCHALTHEVIGPALANISQKRPVAWLYRFITNSQEVIRGNDQYATFLYNSYDQYLMPPFTFLSKDEVTDILAYIKQYSTAPRPVAGSVSGYKEQSMFAEEYAITEKDVLGELSQKQPSDKNAFEGLFTYIMIGVVIITLVILAFLSVLFFKRLNPLKSRK